MGQSIVGQVGHGSTGLFNHIIFSGKAAWYHVAGYVGHIEQNLADVLLHGVELVGDILLRSFKLGHAGLGLFGEVAFAGFHVSADCGGKLIEFGGLVIVVELKCTALVVELEHTVDDLFTVETFNCKALDNTVGISLDLLYG